MLVDRKDLQELSKGRLKEARALLKLGLFDGAYYLAGYAVECALKACIAKGTGRGEFPDKKKVDSSHSHNLRDLIKVAGLDKAVMVSIDISRGAELLNALELAKLKISVALWAYLSEYEDWRLVVSARQ